MEREVNATPGRSEQEALPSIVEAATGVSLSSSHTFGGLFGRLGRWGGRVI